MSAIKLSGWSVSAVAAVWGASLLGVLQIQYLPLDASHSVCGPWGCGPPLPPLIAYHGFWLVLLSLPTVLVCRGLAPSTLRQLGWWLVAMGMCGLVVVGIWDSIPSLPHWLPGMADLPARYWVQRYLLSVVTLIDVPVVPIALAGVCCVVQARSRGRATGPTSDDGTLSTLRLASRSEQGLQEVDARSR